VTDLGWIGLWLLVIGAVAIFLEGVLAMAWTVRISRRAAVLGERMSAEQAAIQADVARLQASLAEMVVLWQPYRRLLRWLRHPLTIALMQSLIRRWAGAR
jgi:hypothetical protein